MKEICHVRYTHYNTHDNPTITTTAIAITITITITTTITTTTTAATIAISTVGMFFAAVVLLTVSYKLII